MPIIQFLGKAHMQDNFSKFAARLDSFTFIPALFDELTNVVFFVKDSQGRYLACNHTLAARCGLRDPAGMLGRTPADIFPAPFGADYLEQDLAVMRSGVGIENQLELHLYSDRKTGWCLTRKLPLSDRTGCIIGLAGISRDLGLPDHSNPVFARVASIAAHIQAHHDKPLLLAPLARKAGLSIAQLERYFHRVFAITPRLMLLRARIDAARTMLTSNHKQTIAHIAHACGYADHSAFSRQFRAVCGTTPSAYRILSISNEPEG